MLRRACFGSMLLVSLIPPAFARDPELPGLTPNHSIPEITGCEGFFTLGRHSELVIGAEERLDCLIREGEIETQGGVDAWDQIGYARARAGAITVFKATRTFDRTRDLPPGMRLKLQDLDGPSPRHRELYTAALDEQSVRLRTAIQGAASFEVHAALTLADEVFITRRSTSFLPTPEDAGALARARAAAAPGVLVHGVLWLNWQRANTLIIYH